MKGYRNILLATDFSEHSELAAWRAADLAQRLGTQLTLLHVIDYCTEDIPPEVVSPDDVNPAEYLVDRARASLATLAEHYGKNNVAHEVILTDHVARKEILHFAKKHQIDIIVIGTHGHHGVTALLGGTADQVLHSAPCDVLLVRTGKTAQDRKGYVRILGATDFLDPSYEAAKRVADLAKAYEAEVMLLHVVEYASELLFHKLIDPEKIDYFTQLRVRAARDALHDLAKAIRYQNAEQYIITGTGAAAHEIVRFAKEHEADLIAVGAHGRFSIDVLLGPTANHVLHGASCDVLAVRLPK